MIEHHGEDLRESRLRDVDLSGSRIRAVILQDVVISDAWVEDVRMEGQIRSLVVNGVDVTPLVEAELDRRHPERRLLQPEDVDGLRRAWAAAIERSEVVVQRARRLPSALLDESVDEEFSFIQTLRHLVFAADRWLTGPVFGDPAPYFHPIGQTHDGAEDGPADGLDPDARPTLAAVLAVRRAQQRRSTAHLERLADDDLQRAVESPNGGTTTVGHCFEVLLREEWWHHQYAERDLAVLEARQG